MPRIDRRCEGPTPMNNSWIPMPFFVLNLIFYLAAVIFPVWVIYCRTHSCKYTHYGSEPHVGEGLVFPSWILYKIPMAYLCCAVTMFNQGYFRLQRNIPLDSSPRDIVRFINANISSWMASNRRNCFAFYVKNDGSSLRHGFARYMEHSKYGICTDSENFGLLPAILCVSGNLHYSMLPVLAYMSWVDWNSKYPDSPPGGLSATGLLLVYLLSTWMMLAYARKVGWNIALVQCGRTIRQRAFKAEWDLGKEFRSPDQQLRWWKNMIIDETSEGKDPIIKLGFGEPEIVSRYLGKSNLGPYADAYADAGLLEDALLKVLKEE